MLAETPPEVHDTNSPPQDEKELVSWLGSLGTHDTNSNVGGSWVDLVKVKKWYYLRLMRWDATNKRKVYVKHIGTLENSKSHPVYSGEAIRLERQRFGVSGGAPGSNPGS